MTHDDWLPTCTCTCATYVCRQHARDIVNIVESTLTSQANTKPLPVSQQRRFRQIQLPDGRQSQLSRLLESSSVQCDVIALCTRPFAANFCLSYLILQTIAVVMFQIAALCTRERMRCIIARAWRSTTSAWCRRHTPTWCSNSSHRSSRNRASTFSEHKNN